MTRFATKTHKRHKTLIRSTINRERRTRLNFIFVSFVLFRGEDSVVHSKPAPKSSSFAGGFGFGATGAGGGGDAGGVRPAGRANLPDAGPEDVGFGAGGSIGGLVGAGFTARAGAGFSTGFSIFVVFGPLVDFATGFVAAAGFVVVVGAGFRGR